MEAAAGLVNVHGGKIAVCRGDDSQIDIDGFGAPQTLKLLLLNGTQQVGLQFRADVTDFVEKIQTVIGRNAPSKANGEDFLVEVDLTLCAGVRSNSVLACMYQTTQSIPNRGVVVHNRDDCVRLPGLLHRILFLGTSEE